MTKDTTADGSLDRRSMLKVMGVAGIASAAGCAGDDPDGDDDTPAADDDDGVADDDGDDDTTPVDTTEYDIGGEFIGTLGANISNYDPTNISDTTSRKTFDLVYESLMEVNFDGEPTEVLAEEIEQTDDLTFRVHLHEGIMFHPPVDREMTAEDVQFSLERYEGTPREGSVFEWYEDSEIIDDYTIDLHLSKPFAPFFPALHEVNILPAGEDIDFSETAVGTGPFVFDEHREDELFRVQRNEDYWYEHPDDEDFPEYPPIETVTLRIVTEQSAQLSALRSGDVDMINNPLPDAISDLEEEDRFEIQRTIGTGYDLYIFPVQHEPFDDARLRRGITRMIPREAVVDVVFHGEAEPAAVPISPMLAEYFDEDFAQEMADEYVGEDQERGLELIGEVFDEYDIDTYEGEIAVNDNPVRVQWAQMIQQTLNETEYFDLSLEEYEWSTYVGMILAEGSQEEEHMVCLGWSAGVDPDDYVREMMTSDQQTPACCNVNHWYTEETDELISEAQQVFDPEERWDLYREAQEIIAEETPIAFLWYQNALNATNADVIQNWEVYPEDGFEFSAMYSPHFDHFTWIAGDE